MLFFQKEIKWFSFRYLNLHYFQMLREANSITNLSNLKVLCGLRSFFDSGNQTIKFAPVFFLLRLGSTPLYCQIVCFYAMKVIFYVNYFCCRFSYLKKKFKTKLPQNRKSDCFKDQSILLLSE